MPSSFRRMPPQRRFGLFVVGGAILFLGATLVPIALDVPVRGVVAISGVAAALTSMLVILGWSSMLLADQRDHDRRRSRDDHLYDRRADAYVKVVEGVDRIWERVGAIFPVANVTPDPLRLSDEERAVWVRELRHLDALVVSVGSAEVRDLVVELRGLEREFWANSERYESPYLQGSNRLIEAEDVRHRYFDVMSRLRERIGEELGELPPP